MTKRGEVRPLAEREIGVGELGELLGLNTIYIQQLAKKGIIPRSGRGRYILKDAINAYCATMRKSAQGRPLGGGGPDGDGKGPNYHEEKARLTKLQADKVQINNDRELSDLVNAAEVEREWSLVISDCKNRLLSIPSKMAPILAPITEPALIMNVADDLIREALDELASYAERRSKTASGQDDSLAPTAKDDDQRLG